MYRIYYTDPKLPEVAQCKDVVMLYDAIETAAKLRSAGMQYVTTVSDYPDMVGLPGAKGAGSEYVPQLKN